MKDIKDPAGYNLYPYCYHCGKRCGVFYKGGKKKFMERGATIVFVHVHKDGLECPPTIGGYDKKEKMFWGSSKQ